MNAVINERYAEFSLMLQNAQKLTIEVFLNTIDFHTMDFFKLKYFKQLGSLYYINKIKNFKGNGLVDVEAIRIKSFEQRGQFNDDFNDDFNNI
jgi:hypothetical protein